MNDEQHPKRIYRRNASPDELAKALLEAQGIGVDPQGNLIYPSDRGHDADDALPAES